MLTAWWLSVGESSSADDWLASDEMAPAVTGRALVVRGDALRLPLPDGCIDLIVTSPPYLWKRKYAINGVGELGNEPDWQQFLTNLWAVTDEMLRVLKPVGSIFVNLGDTRVTSREPKWLRVPVKSRLLLPERYRIGCQDRGIIVRQVQVWWKANGLPESVDDRTRDEHEDWVHLVKQPRYYSAIDEVREPQHGKLPAAYGNIGADGGHQGNQEHRGPGNLARGAFRLAPGGRKYNNLGKLPGSVWTLPSEPLRLPAWLGVDHYAAFPSEWPRRFILGWSPPGICVDCSTGRFPVVDRSYSDPIPGNDLNGRRRNQPDATWSFAERKETTATILGYACACTPYTDHPERRGRDFHAGTDRTTQGMNDGNGGERFRRYQEELTNPRGPVREYHLDRWIPPPTRPALVLDPFGGTGTTAMVARALGRHAITIDLSHDYCRAAQWRIFQSGNAGKALARTNLERQGMLT